MGDLQHTSGKTRTRLGALLEPNRPATAKSGEKGEAPQTKGFRRGGPEPSGEGGEEAQETGETEEKRDGDGAGRRESGPKITGAGGIPARNHREIS